LCWRLPAPSARWWNFGNWSLYSGGTALDIRDISILADYFVIGSTTSERQARAIIEDIKQETKQAFDVRPLNIEGEAATGWVLMDYGGVVVHLFTPEMRAYYDLEELWRAGRVVVRML
jgi:ribosome-associated protein